MQGFEINLTSDREKNKDKPLEMKDFNKLLLNDPFTSYFSSE